MIRVKIFFLILLSNLLYAEYTMTNVIKDDWQLDQEGIKLVGSSREYFLNQDYVKSINSLNKALKIKKEIYGEATPQVALIYSFLGGVYSSMYDYKKALFFYNKSYKILEKHKVLSTRHSSYIHHNLSFLHRDMGDNKQALKYMKKYISAKEGYYIKNYIGNELQIQLGKDVSIAEDYRHVALIYLSLKEYKSAKNYLEASINIYERTLGRTHFITSFSYRTLGYLFLLTNDFDMALYYLTLALKIQEKNLKESNAYISQTYTHLSVLYSKTDSPCKAYSFSLLSFNNFLKRKNKSFAILNSKQKISYLSNNNGGIYSLMNHLIQCSILSKNKKMDSASLDTFTSWIKYKGNIFEYENILTMVESQVLDLDVKKDIKNLKILTQRLASNQFYIKSTKDLTLRTNPKIC